jgi:hypothetical protein
MSVVDDLIAARALIENPENWIKGENFRLVDGRACYCMDGALQAVGVGVDGDAWWALNDHLGGYTHLGLIWFNDAAATTHSDVMALFDRAIDAARAYHEELE